MSHYIDGQQVCEKQSSNQDGRTANSPQEQLSRSRSFGNFQQGKAYDVRLGVLLEEDSRPWAHLMRMDLSGHGIVSALFFSWYVHVDLYVAQIGGGFLGACIDWICCFAVYLTMNIWLLIRKKLSRDFEEAPI